MIIMRGGWSKRMAINLDKLSLAELTTLKTEVETAIVTRKEAEKAEALAKIRALAAESGFSLEELVKAPRKARGSASAEKSDKRSIVAPKFAHPENPGTTWTGRGKPPKWLAEFEAAGRNREEFLIGKN